MTALEAAPATGDAPDPAAAKAPVAKKPAKKTRPQARALKPKRMSGWDFATWRTSSDDPAMRSPIIGLVLLDGTPDWDTLVERFILASRVAPILRQRVIEGPADFVNPRLIVDADFDLSFTCADSS